MNSPRKARVAKVKKTRNAGQAYTCGLIGYPLGHSVSPQMHNAAFKHLNLNYKYITLETKPGTLEKTLARIREARFRGANVTIPYKEKASEIVDFIHLEALGLLAVNTIVNDGGMLVGYNTDMPGFLRAVKAHKARIKGKKVLILGAGGAARAVTAACLKDGAKHITVVGRKKRKVAEYMETVTLSDNLDGSTFGEIGPHIKEYDLIVNCTPVGMHPNTDASPIDAAKIRKGATVFDVVYNPLETKLMRDSKKRGARTISGIDMLVYQGAEAFELWTGIKAPVGVMKKAALSALR